MASAEMRIGSTARGSGWRRQSIVRLPSQRIGRCRPESVTTLSPTRRRSTGTSPRWVRIRVPCMKQTIAAMIGAAVAPASGTEAASMSCAFTAVGVAPT